MVRCMDKVFGRKDVEAKYIPLDMSMNAIQYLATLVPAHLLIPLWTRVLFGYDVVTHELWLVTIDVFVVVR